MDYKQELITTIHDLGLDKGIGRHPRSARTTAECRPVRHGSG
jgi:hypothetical protein